MKIAIRTVMGLVALVVCAENLIRIDWGRESPNLGRS